MSLITLLIFIAIGAAALTAIVGYFKVHRSWFLTFLQNYTGLLFLVSGFVKAVDPIGTQYKMEQYFAEFEQTFKGANLNSLASLFPIFSKYALTFAIVTIILELMIGMMLLLGSRSRFTSWAFLLLIAFFTILTGFTYLTGYVPQGVNFFDFSKWGAYEVTNMRVTDCGCFGDFIKLEPKISFLKDVALLFPAFIFIFRYKYFHHLFNRKVRFGILTASLIGFTAFCFQNTFWDLPVIDFRPFKIGTNIPERKATEEKAASDVQIIGYSLINEKNGATASLMAPPGKDVVKDYVELMKPYPSEAGWKIKDQIKTEPTTAHTKISDFSISNVEGSEVTEDLLTDKGYSLMVVAYKLYKDGENKTTVYVTDSTFVYDTLKVKVKNTMTTKVVKRATGVEKKAVQEVEPIWNQEYLKSYTDKITPLAKAAKASNVKTYVITGINSPKNLLSFQKAVGADYPFYTADDILLKTIIRSNPGVVLLKNGVVQNMWHITKLPNFEQLGAKN